MSEIAKNIVVNVGDIAIANHLPFTLIAGPCQIESESHAMEVAAELVAICGGLGIPLIYKSSYDKANRTSAGGQREFAPVLARSALAVGVAALFIEAHPDPDNAPSDGPVMIPLDQMKNLLTRLQQFDQLAKS